MKNLVKSVLFVPVLFLTANLFWFLFYLIFSLYFHYISGSIWKIFGLMPVSFIVVGSFFTVYFLLTTNCFKLVQNKYFVYITVFFFSLYHLYYLIKFYSSLSNDLSSSAQDITMPFWLYTFFVLNQLIITGFVAYNRAKQLGTDYR